LICEWCGSQNIENKRGSVYWELPDGSRAIEISETPTWHCGDCNMIYQSEELVKEIENQLFIIDCSQFEKKITFDELMNRPKLLKRNYFDFS
jgi:uncharacterized YokU family protein